jgi:hypothetical protein
MQSQAAPAFCIWRVLTPPMLTTATFSVSRSDY